MERLSSFEYIFLTTIVCSMSAVYIGPLENAYNAYRKGDMEGDKLSAWDKANLDDTPNLLRMHEHGQLTRAEVLRYHSKLQGTWRPGDPENVRLGLMNMNGGNQQKTFRQLTCGPYTPQKLENLRLLSEHATMHTLDLTENNVGVPAIHAIVHITSLKTLILDNNSNVGDEGARTLAGSTTLVDVELVNCGIGAEGAAALAENTSLKSLNLELNFLENEGAVKLSNNRSFENLILANCEIGNEGAHALAHNNTTLRNLNLRGNMITFMTFPANSSITILNLSDNSIGAAAAAVLASCTSLKTLILDNNNVGDEGARAFAFANGTTLKSLSLGRNNITDTGVEDLAQNRTIQTLNLSGNDTITTIGAETLFQNSTLINLYLSNTQVFAYPSVVKKMLVSLAENTSLRTVDLSGNLIDPYYGVRKLGKNKTLTTLVLRFDNLHDEDATYLANISTLTSLDLSGNNVGFTPQFGAALAAHESLKELKLQSQQISFEFLLELTKSNTIETLDMSNCFITDGAARIIARNKHFKTLYLSENKITDAGATALIENKRLKYVNLEFNEISEDVKMLLEDRFPLQN